MSSQHAIFLPKRKKNSILEAYPLEFIIKIDVFGVWNLKWLIKFSILT